MGMRTKVVARACTDLGTGTIYSTLLGMTRDGNGPSRVLYIVDKRWGPIDIRVYIRVYLT